MENDFNSDEEINKNISKLFEYKNNLELSQKRIKEFGELKENWDERGGSPPDSKSIKLSLEMLPFLFSAGVPPDTHVETDIIVFGYGNIDDELPCFYIGIDGNSKQIKFSVKANRNHLLFKRCEFSEENIENKAEILSNFIIKKLKEINYQQN